MVDGRGERHDVALQRFMGGYAVRVDGDLLYDGEVYETANGRSTRFGLPGAMTFSWMPSRTV